MSKYCIEFYVAGEKKKELYMVDMDWDFVEGVAWCLDGEVEIRVKFCVVSI